MDNYSILNNYLVGFFNEILKIEENSLNSACCELSLSEMHTVEAIANSGDANAGDIAAKLNITQSTLSVALKTLENKNYIVRQKDMGDKRQVNIYLTEKGKAVNERHQDFHHKMVNEIISCLSAKELEIFMKGLEKLKNHFYSLKI